MNTCLAFVLAWGAPAWAVLQCQVCWFLSKSTSTPLCYKILSISGSLPLVLFSHDMWTALSKILGTISLSNIHSMSLFIFSPNIPGLLIWGCSYCFPNILPCLYLNHLSQVVNELKVRNISITKLNGLLWAITWLINIVGQGRDLICLYGSGGVGVVEEDQLSKLSSCPNPPSDTAHCPRFWNFIL